MLMLYAHDVYNTKDHSKAGQIFQKCLKYFGRQSTYKLKSKIKKNLGGLGEGGAGLAGTQENIFYYLKFSFFKDHAELTRMFKTCFNSKSANTVMTSVESGVGRAEVYLGGGGSSPDPPSTLLDTCVFAIIAMVIESTSMMIIMMTLKEK